MIGILRSVRGLIPVAALSGVALFMASNAFADSKPKTPAAASPPAVAAPAPAQQAAPPPSTIIQLQAEPNQADWIKTCGDDQATKKKICLTTRDFVSDQNQPVLAVAVYDVQGDPQKSVRFILPLGFMLQTGARYTVDQQNPQAAKFQVCVQSGCFTESLVKDDVIAAMKKGASLSISVQNQYLREIVFQVPLSTFGKVFDGPPVDPSVLVAQQKKMQEEMQKRAEEMRKSMGQQQGQQPGQQPLQPAAPQPQVPAQ